MGQAKLLRDVDFMETRRNSRKVLRDYSRLDRIAGRSSIDVRSPLITGMPKVYSNGNRSEDAIIQQIDAEKERDAILNAFLALRLTSRQILHCSFCVPDRYSNTRLSQELGYSIRQIERLKAEALIEFAESYKAGKLIEWK